MFKFFVKLFAILIASVGMMIFAKLLFFSHVSQKPSTPTPPPVVAKPDIFVLIEEIQKKSRLETATVAFAQVIPEEKNQNSLWGLKRDKLLFVATGKAVAGVDLSKFGKNDIKFNDFDSVEISLPKAEIFHVIIDEANSYVASRETGLLAKVDNDMETAVRRKAEIRCRNHAINNSILEIANKNAKEEMERFLTIFGFKEIKFVDKIEDKKIPKKPSLASK